MSVEKIPQVNFFSGDNVSDVVLSVIQDIQSRGIVGDSRNGEVKKLTDVTMEFTNPIARSFHIDGRKSNIFQLIAESFWVLGGQDILEPYLTTFLPRAPQYSDDGKTWHDAYGPRLLGSEYVCNQLQDAADLLIASPDERRAYCSIYDPQRDSATARHEYGVSKPKAIPCNLGLIFWIEDNKLNMKVWQRSGDMFFGAGSINPFEFSLIHEIMHSIVAQAHPTLELGYYRHNVINAHLYTGMDVVSKQLKAIEEQNNFLGWNTSANRNLDDNIPFDGEFADWNEVRDFFSVFIVVMSKFIDGSLGLDDISVTSNVSVIKKGDKVSLILIATDYERMFNNYCAAVIAYIAQRKGIEVRWDVTKHDNMMITTAFERAIRDSSFRKFTLTISDARG